MKTTLIGNLLVQQQFQYWKQKGKMIYTLQDTNLLENRSSHTGCVYTSILFWIRSVWISQ